MAIVSYSLTGSVSSSMLTHNNIVFHHLTCEYPFNGEFMPTSSRAAFDPFSEDPFDAYNISDVNDFSKYNWLNDEK